MGKLTSLLDGLKPPSELRRDYMGASAIGNSCWRKIWFDYHGHERAELPVRIGRIFDVGKLLEKYILGLLKQVTGVEDGLGELKHTEYPWFRGTPDAYLPKLDALLEIKTANHASFQKLVNHGFRKWDEQYYGQVQTYMGLSGIHKAYVLVFDKNSKQFYDELVTFDPLYYEQLVMKAKSIHDSESMPPRVSNNPLWWTCKMCAFRSVCHE